MKFLYNRKHNKEVYSFYVNRVVSWTTEKPRYYIVVKSPENCCGYRDTIMLDSRGNCAGTDRYHAPYVLKALKKQIETATEKYCNEKFYFTEV